MAPGVTQGDASVFTKKPPHLCGGDHGKPGQLSEGQIEEFYDKGFVIMKNFFEPNELFPCLKDIEELVEKLAQKLFKGGKITDLHQDLGVYERLSAIEKDFPGSNILLHKIGSCSPAFQALWSNHRLLNIVEQLIGPDIAGHPVWNLRPKTPQSEAATVPWHQDNAYLDADVHSTLQPSAWIPLLDCDPVHGCLEFMVGGHKSGRLAEHECCAGDTWYVEMKEGEAERTLGVNLEKDIVQTPIKFGDFILFNNLVPHRSLDNFSDKIRWTLDLRWQDPSKPYGFYGLKQGVVMRSSQDPGLKIDWDKFNGVDRHKIQIGTVEEELQKEGISKDQFDTTIAGPWMKRWDIVYHNRHTKNLQTETGTSWHRPY